MDTTKALYEVIRSHMIAINDLEQKMASHQAAIDAAKAIIWEIDYDRRNGTPEEKQDS